MSKVIKEYYVCDYCGKKADSYKEFKYTDNSGLNDKCYDICSDECFEKHKRFLARLYSRKPKHLNFDFSGTVEDHIKEEVWQNF